MDSSKRASGMMYSFIDSARVKVEAKRKRKGLGELRRQRNNPYASWIVNCLTLTGASFFTAPFERARLIHQTRILNGAHIEIPGTPTQIIPYIVNQQGASALWRGVMANVYKQWLQVGVKICFYDRFKNMFMPYDSHKYGGIDFVLRVVCASCLSTVFTFALVYPFELIHTRLAVDMTPKNQARLYKSTFQCFNRTNVDEFKMGLYKGWQFSLASAGARMVISLPVYEVTQRVLGTKQAKSVKGVVIREEDSWLRKFNLRIGSAMISGTLISLLIYPIDSCMRLNMLIGGRGFKTEFSDIADFGRKFQGRYGIQSLWRGAPMYGLTQVLFAFAQYTLYDNIKTASRFDLD